MKRYNKIFKENESESQDISLLNQALAILMNVEDYLTEEDYKKLVSLKMQLKRKRGEESKQSDDANYRHHLN